MPKYIFENGVMKLDPSYRAEQAAQGKPASTLSPQALTPVCSMTDISSASTAQQAATGKPLIVSDSTVSSIQIMQDPGYLAQFGTKTEMDGSVLLEKLTELFEKYEVPIGLVNKLLALTEYQLDFIFDDSGSMRDDSDVFLKDASSYVADARRNPPRNSKRELKLSRWEEAEDRMHIIIDILAYLPMDKITISFLNRQDRIELIHKGKTPEEFAQEYHRKITEKFNTLPSGGTPILPKLQSSFAAPHNTMHYLFTDGEPSGGEEGLERVRQLVLNRANPKMHPLTLMSCTNQGAEWMKKLEEEAKFVSELDDFQSEAQEVAHDQGPAFPFTRGFWLICQLVAAINPDDLDALDDEPPLTYKTMNDLMGRTITMDEYRKYFQSHPKRVEYAPYQQEFERGDILARVITDRIKAQSGAPSAPPGYPVAPAYPYQPYAAGSAGFYSQPSQQAYGQQPYGSGQQPYGAGQGPYYGPKY